MFHQSWGRPRLQNSIRAVGPSSINVNWNYGCLQEATSLTGPWTYVSGATSPYTIAVNPSEKTTYFRIALVPSGSPGTL